MLIAHSSAAWNALFLTRTSFILDRNLQTFDLIIKKKKNKKYLKNRLNDGLWAVLCKRLQNQWAFLLSLKIQGCKCLHQLEANPQTHTHPLHLKGVKKKTHIFSFEWGNVRAGRQRLNLCMWALHSVLPRGAQKWATSAPSLLWVPPCGNLSPTAVSTFKSSPYSQQTEQWHDGPSFFFFFLPLF